uniref:Uncharacterized protein n=1 Tax=Pyrodinium bahamense TaxID=73915 RepID=A0A7S0B0R2_9DINO
MAGPAGVRQQKPLAMQCPAGHTLHCTAVGAGHCDQCERGVFDGELAVNCRKCDWYLCTTCSPPRCPCGHTLQFSAAGNPVIKCPQCNWYLCVTRRPPSRRVTKCPSGHRCNWFVCDTCHVQEKPQLGSRLLSLVMAALPQFDAFGGKCWPVRWVWQGGAQWADGHGLLDVQLVLVHIVPSGRRTCCHGVKGMRQDRARVGRPQGLAARIRSPVMLLAFFCLFPPGVGCCK